MEAAPTKKQSAAKQIYEQLCAKIINGELRSGEQLLTETELCQMYRMSRRQRPAGTGNAVPSEPCGNQGGQPEDGRFHNPAV